MKHTGKQSRTAKGNTGKQARKQEENTQENKAVDKTS